MKKQIMMSLLAGAAMFSLSTAQAAVVNLTATFDATQPMWNSPSVLGFHKMFGSDKVLSVGDVVDLTLTFKPNQSLRYTAGNDGGNFIVATGMMLSANGPNRDSQYKVGNLSMQLLGASSNVPLETAPWDYVSGGGASMDIDSTATLAANQSVTFTGVHTRFTVQELQYATNYYDSATLVLLPTNGSISISAVPEPETWAMLAGGLGLLVLARRRKKAA